MTRLLSVALATAVALSSGCVMKPGGPDFKRYSREHQLPVVATQYRAEELGLEVISGSVSETYFVYGSENFTAHIKVTLTNHGRQPITVGMKTLSATRVGSEQPSTTYFNDVVIEPGAHATATINIPAGLTKLERPTALYYKGIRIELKY